MSEQPGTAVRHIALDRNQLRWETLDVEGLIPADHGARMIWEISGRMDLSRFEEGNKNREGKAGRPSWPAQLLVSVWVYSYTLGVASARAIERMMSQEPGLRWLAACETINYHTLADFRVGHGAALEELFAQFLALLEEAGLVNLRLLLQDGTKVPAVAGRQSLHRRPTLERRLREARKVLRELDRQAVEGGEPAEVRQRAAQARAAREGLARAQAALEKLQQLEAHRAPSQAGEVRVSVSEPEARKMKQPDGGWAPSYNVQFSTEAQSRMVVAVGVSAAANDTHELLPALERVQANCGVRPKEVIADSGYATRENVEQTSARDIALIAPWKEEASRQAGACRRQGIAPEFRPAAFRLQPGGQSLLCPAGKSLVRIGERHHHGVRKQIFLAQASDCRRCPWRQRCCRQNGGPRRIERTVESPAMRSYLARMKRRTTQVLYRRRCEIAEFPQLWAKGVKRWRRFSVRGLLKAGLEALWVALAYNLSQWIRLKRETPALA